MNWRLILVLLACASFWLLLIGLVVGEGWLRVGGLAGMVLFFLTAFILDQLVQRSERHRMERLPRPVQRDWNWPRRAA